MNERCDNCGAELFAGQQFCRQCGAPTRQLSTGEVPTQILPGGQGQPQQPPPPTASQPRAATTRLPGRDTDEVYRSRVEQFLNPPPAPIAPLSPMSLEGGGRSGWPGWLIALVCVLGFLVVGSIFAARYVTQQLARKVVVVNKGRQGVRVDVPPLPPMPDMPPPGAPDDADFDALDEDGAQVSGDETVITKTFPLKAGAAFSLANTSGDISVEGWDGAEAQVKVTKRGGSAGEREEVEIMHQASDRELSFRTGEHADGVREVRYEIKLPRGVRQIEINSRDSNVTLANFAGDVSVSVMRGDFSLKGLTGTVSARTMKGDIDAGLKGATPAGPQSLNAVSGNITLSVGGANAELKAETVSGDVSADGDLGLSVEKRVAGEHAAGTLGKGGESIVAKTVSGNIKIKH
ncbi:MAG TPA: DUF4097 family beta strand repeat-containing protein [Pyrinomonadaceae bacterium]|jgi:hypothetical protein